MLNRYGSDPPYRVQLPGLPPFWKVAQRWELDSKPSKSLQALERSTRSPSAISKVEMTEIKIDRTGWDSGQWDYEPDRLLWEHAGFPCLILRNSLGNLCGYVGVTKDHPWYDQDYDNIEADAHGGLTYGDRSGAYIGNDNPDLFWVGFDCAHLGDLVPGMEATSKRLNLSRAPRSSVYRDLVYVKLEVENLAKQAGAARIEVGKRLKRMIAFEEEE